MPFHRHHQHLRLIVAGLLACGAVVSAPTGARAQCTPDWQAGNAFPGIAGPVFASVMFDDGTGPALYVGGQFSLAGGTEVASLAKWTGSGWAAVGSGGGIFGNDVGNPANPNRTPGVVYALAVRNGKLYVGGTFRRVGTLVANNIAVYTVVNGTPVWSTVANGSVVGFPKAVNQDTHVKSLAAGPDGVYIGGVFTSTNSANIAKTDGVTITALSGTGSGGGSSANYGTGGLVSSLVAYDDGLGGGTQIYAGGVFSDMNGEPGTNGLARYSPGAGTWQGVESVAAQVSAMVVFDEDGDGPAHPALIVTGTGLLLNGLGSGGAADAPTSGVAKWDGASWQTVGDAPYNLASSLAVHVVGSTPRLFAGTYQQTNSIVRMLNGASWQDVPGAFRLDASGGTGTTPAAYTIASMGSDLFVGGRFSAVEGAAAGDVCRWSGTTWGAMPAGNGPLSLFGSEYGVSGGIESLVTLDADGAGAQRSAVYAVGTFECIGGVVAKHIARFDGTDWTPLGEGIGTTGSYDRPISMVAFDDGTGSALYSVNTQSTSATLRKWNGSSWMSFPGFAFVPSADPDTIAPSAGVVNAALAFDIDGPGGPELPAIYVGGWFTTMNGLPVSNIAKWDGAAWSAVSSAQFDGSIQAMCVHNNQLVVAGGFTHIDGAPISYVAAWNGTQWSALGDGANGPVRAMASYAGSLYIGGAFTAPGVGVARWNGTWSSIGGVNAPFVRSVNAMTVANTGASSLLVVGGQFDSVGGLAAPGIAAWDGSVWSGISGGVTQGSANRGGSVMQLASLGSQLVIAGGFSHVGSTGAATLGVWGCPPAVCIADIASLGGTAGADGQTTVDDLIVYLSAFFGGNLALADIASLGGEVTPDNQLTVDDLIAYLSAFFSGCH